MGLFSGKGLFPGFYGISAMFTSTLWYREPRNSVNIVHNKQKLTFARIKCVTTDFGMSFLIGRINSAILINTALHSRYSPQTPLLKTHPLYVPNTCPLYILFFSLFVWNNLSTFCVWYIWAYIVYRNKWLGNTINFRYSANILKIKSRGFDRAQYCNFNQI